MSIDICPTITASDLRTYHVQMEQIAGFAKRVHIDIADGSLMPVKLLGIEHIWWPAGLTADLHLMTKQPGRLLKAAAGLKPHLIIFHAEAEGDFTAMAEYLHRCGIKVGIALLPQTDASLIEPALSIIDHVLIFSGNLGHFGGHADLKLVTKATRLKGLKPQLEIGWDGGINAHNAFELVKSGVSVLNAGGYIHGAKKPSNAYRVLKLATQEALEPPESMSKTTNIKVRAL